MSTPTDRSIEPSSPSPAGDTSRTWLGVGAAAMALAAAATMVAGVVVTTASPADTSSDAADTSSDDAVVVIADDDPFPAEPLIVALPEDDPVPTPNAPGDDATPGTSSEVSATPPTTEPAPAPEPAPVPSPSKESIVQGFLDGFVADHLTRDDQHLRETLHPAIPMAFGADVCGDYIGSTIGSITGAQLVSVGEVRELELATPHGPISFAEAIPFTVEFTLRDGTTVSNDAHLPIHDGGVHWLTTCGVQVD